MTNSAATVALTVQPGGLATEYYLEYGTTTSYGSTTTQAAVADVTGVQPESVPLAASPRTPPTTTRLER